MCGIAGLSLVAENKSLTKRFLSLKKSLIHRGPDGSGVYKKKKNKFDSYEIINS